MDQAQGTRPVGSSQVDGESGAEDPALRPDVSLVEVAETGYSSRCTLGDD